MPSDSNWLLLIATRYISCIGSVAVIVVTVGFIGEGVVIGGNDLIGFVVVVVGCTLG
jgi:hypothetical protein